MNGTKEQNARVAIYIPQARTIDIVDQNDRLLGTFEILKDEIDILERFSSIQERSEKEQFKEDTKAQIKLLVEARSFIDEILGEGALEQITGGKSIGLSYTMAILEMVTTELMRINNEKIARDYE